MEVNLRRIPIQLARWVSELEPELLSGLTGFGLFCTAYTIIYSCGPFLTGLLSVTVGLNEAMRLSATGAAAAMLLVLLYRRFILQKHAP